MTRMLPRIATGLGLSCVGLLLGGCVTSTIQEVRESATGIETHESIVVLGRRHKGGDATEDKFVDCVSAELGKGKTGLGIVGDDEFVDALFPWFEPHHAPLKTTELPRMLSRPLLAERLTEIGVRYMIWIEGSTEALEGGGSISCAAGAGAGGCFGLMWWEKDSDYEASVWDVREAVGTGTVSTDVNGMSVVPAVVVPIPLIAPTQGKACRRLAEQLRMFIVEGVT